MIALLPQLRHRKTSDEIGGSTARRRFCRHRFGTVFAKLEGRGVIGIGPGAARTIEAIRLIGRQQGTCTLARYALLENLLRHAFERAPAAGRTIVNLDYLFTHDRLCTCLLNAGAAAIAAPASLSCLFRQLII